MDPDLPHGSRPSAWIPTFRMDPDLPHGMGATCSLLCNVRISPVRSPPQSAHDSFPAICICSTAAQKFSSDGTAILATPIEIWELGEIEGIGEVDGIDEIDGIDGVPRSKAAAMFWFHPMPSHLTGSST